MNYLKYLTIPILSILFTMDVSATIYEDAEDQNTTGWKLSDDNPSGATITNVFDTTQDSRVIALNGSGRLNSYELGAKSGADAWNNSSEKTIKWSMSIAEKYKIYITLQTEKGLRYLYYTHGTSDKGFINNKYIHYGLGEGSMDGTWQEFTRNLEADLQRYESDNHILTVNGFKIQGSAKLDDIELVVSEALPEISQDNPQLILNEYSAVLPVNYLKNGGTDTSFGRVRGNGGSWIELVSTGEHVDIRGALLTINQAGSDQFKAKIPYEPQLGHLRRGTIITISSEPTDMSYAPFSSNGDDWTLNINVNDLLEKEGLFETSSREVSVALINESGGEYLLLPSGEEHATVSIDAREVFKLKTNPQHGTLPSDTTYGDDNNGKTYSTFGAANQWGSNGEFHQSFNTLRANQDLIEVGGIVVSNIAALSSVTDAESILYLPQNNALWIADDDAHKVFEMDFTTQVLRASYDDVLLGTFAETIADECDRGEDIGACDLESIAYDESSDNFYIFSGKSSSQSAIFRLERGDISESFVLVDYVDLAGHEYSDALFVEGEMLVASSKNIYTYDYSTNSRSGDYLFRSPDGKIHGMAYANGTLWLTTSTFKLIKVNWSSKVVEAIYDMTKNGVYDPRGIEVINNKLYILEGMNSNGTNQVLAPLGHALKNSIHIYDIP